MRLFGKREITKCNTVEEYLHGRDKGLFIYNLHADNNKGCENTVIGCIQDGIAISVEKSNGGGEVMVKCDNGFEDGDNLYIEYTFAHGEPNVRVGQHIGRDDYIAYLNPGYWFCIYAYYGKKVNDLTYYDFSNFMDFENFNNFPKGYYFEVGKKNIWDDKYGRPKAIGSLYTNGTKR